MAAALLTLDLAMAVDSVFWLVGPVIKCLLLHWVHWADLQASVISASSRATWGSWPQSFQYLSPPPCLAFSLLPASHALLSGHFHATDEQWLVSPVVLAPPTWFWIPWPLRSGARSRVLGSVPFPLSVCGDPLLLLCMHNTWPKDWHRETLMSVCRVDTVTRKERNPFTCSLVNFWLVSIKQRKNPCSQASRPSSRDLGTFLFFWWTRMVHPDFVLCNHSTHLNNIF